MHDKQDPETSRANGPDGLERGGAPIRQKRDGKIPLTVWQIGIMMFLVNASFVMAYSFSGLYLKHVLAASAISIGMLEGFCETISHLMKLFSGMLSDYFGKRKGIMVVGYVLSVLSRPLLSIADSFYLVFSARAMERIGNGIQASPRDAIVADVAPRKRIGASYGLKRSLAYLGSLCGGIFGFVAMKYSNNNYRMVFALASIPAIIAFLTLLFCVKEPNRFDHPAITSESPLPAPKLKPKFSFKNFKYLSLSFWLIMLVNAIFMMARMNETFLILRMNEGFQPDPMFAPLVMIVFNIGTTMSSYPIGLFGDKFDRTKILFIGIASLVIADIIMYSSISRVTMYIGILFWGIQLGATQNVFVSLVAEKVPEDLRGTGLGVYWLINAISAFVADTLAGFVAHHISLNGIFVSSGIIGVFALVILALLLNILHHPFKQRNQS
ncbi:MAG: MFS transporter [Holosporales bacterium]|jgi:MFS family permease|nr:MFS transporter [Holosporales bacterium]